MSSFFLLSPKAKAYVREGAPQIAGDAALPKIECLSSRLLRVVVSIAKAQKGGGFEVKSSSFRFGTKSVLFRLRIVS